jgi:hypothetical protein
LHPLTLDRRAPEPAASSTPPRRPLRRLGVAVTAVAVALSGTAIAASPAHAAPQTNEVFGFGGAGDLGAPGTRANRQVGIAATRSGNGYWTVSTDGGVFAHGDAPFHGSMGGQRMSKPIVAVATTAKASGYWLVASDGGIFSFGAARFHGSTGAQRLHKPIVGMAGTPSGNGYWLVASDGGIFAYGDARFHGSMGGKPLNKPVVGIARTPSGNGYWLVASDGGVFNFGDARFHGSSAAQRTAAVSMESTPSGNGYWIASQGGGVFSFGDARFFGSLGGQDLGAPVTDVTVRPNGDGYWIATGRPAPPPPPPPAPAAAPAVNTQGNRWDQLAQCESGGRWNINTGNGYYGGVQFSASSWRAVGGTGLAHQHSRETQIAMAERLLVRQGWGAWPHCSRKLGFR